MSEKVTLVNEPTYITSLTDWNDFFNNMILEEDRQLISLTFVFMSAAEHTKYNIDLLDHNYETDVITVNHNIKNNIKGDILINYDIIDRVANDEMVTPTEEASRYMIHGVLHLLGYNDKDRNEFIIMKERENYWLKVLQNVSRGTIQ